MKTAPILVLSLSCFAAIAQETKAKIELTTPVEHIVYEPLSKFFVGEAILVRSSTDGSLDLKNVRILSDQAEVSKEGDDFVVIAKKAGEITLRLYDFTVVEKPVLIETKTITAFATIPAGSLAASLNGKTGGRITHDEIINAVGMKLLNPESGGDRVDKTVEIVSFTMSVFHKERDPVLNLRSDGSKITSEMKALLKESPRGSKVYFEYVKAGNPNSDDHSMRSLPPLAFVLADD